ncbi:hypothetical protein ACFX13_044429 [Malus domestica]
MDRSFTAKDIRQAQPNSCLGSQLVSLRMASAHNCRSSEAGAETGRNCVLVVIHVNVELHGVVRYELEALNRQHLLFRPLFCLGPRLLWPWHDYADNRVQSERELTEFDDPVWSSLGGCRFAGIPYDFAHL